MLGRFLQADTIVPNPGDPVSWDRYAYVRNSPLVYNDPTGHNLNCGMQGSAAAPEDCAEADPDGDGSIPLFSSWPEDKDIPNPEDRSDYINLAREYYEKMRMYLYNNFRWKYLSNDGKINDIVLMAMIIFGEFGGFKYSASTVFNEAKEALSNQYDSTNTSANIQCGGDGCTLAEQLGWLSDVESWYSGVIYNNGKSGGWLRYMDDAADAAGNFYVGDDTSWMWGDVTNEELGNYDWVVRTPSRYPKKDWFIVH
jgi:hypothetical protein